MAELSTLPTTRTGHIRKRTAMNWLVNRETPDPDAVKASVVPKPADFSGSKYATSVSSIRVTGDPVFVESVARFFREFSTFENEQTRLEINLQRTEDRDTGELTDNYALYLSVAERG